jgi:hypothetical protein
MVEEVMNLNKKVGGPGLRFFDRLRMSGKKG